MKTKQPKISVIPPLFQFKPLPLPAIPNVCHRPGAFDFLKCPSRMSDTSVTKNGSVRNP